LRKGSSKLAGYDDGRAEPSFFEGYAPLPGLIRCSGTTPVRVQLLVKTDRRIVVFVELPIGNPTAGCHRF